MDFFFRNVIEVVDDRMLIFDPKNDEEDFFFHGESIFYNIYSFLYMSSWVLTIEYVVWAMGIGRFRQFWPPPNPNFSGESGLIFLT